MTTLNWKDVTPEYIKERAAERRENAKQKYQQVLEEYQIQGYSKATSEVRADAWLAKTLAGWDDFEREQLAHIARR